MCLNKEHSVFQFIEQDNNEDSGLVVTLNDEFDNGSFSLLCSICHKLSFLVILRFAQLCDMVVLRA